MSKHLKLRLRRARTRDRRKRRARHRPAAVGWRARQAANNKTGALTAGRHELALFAALYASYDAARWIWASRRSVARAHAHRVIEFERSLHIAVEASVQRALDSWVVSFVLSNIYLAAQLIVLPGALLWLYRRSPGVYRQLRNTVVAAWLISTPIFALYPVAPPRLAGVGIKDLVSHQAAVTLTGQSTMFYNPYAAVPSLHVGLAFAVGLAAAVVLRQRWAKALALLWGPIVTVAVIATGNHYLFDAATGLLLAAVSFAVTRGLSVCRVGARRGRRVVRPSRPATAIGRLRPEAASGEQ